MSRQDKLNALVREFFESDGKDEIVDVEFPDHEDPLRVLLKALPTQTGHLIELVQWMDELDMEDGAAAQEMPLSGGSSNGTAPKKITSEVLAPEEAERRSARRQRSAQVKKAVKSLLDKNNIPPEQRVPISIQLDMPSSYDFVISKEIYGMRPVFSLSQLPELKRQLDEIDDKFRATSQPQTDVVRAFTAEYVGDAPERLLKYLHRCWEKFCQPNEYTYPYCAIVQSSGFGKSRLLRELAVKTNVAVKGGGRRTDVLYTCVREDPRSTGYPYATRQLSEYFFPDGDLARQRYGSDALVKDLAKRLLAAFEFAMFGIKAHVGSMMMKLFTGDQVGVLNGIQHREGFASLPLPKPKASHLLIFAIDEARALLPSKEQHGVGWFRILRRALAAVNKIIATKWNDKSGVFCVVIDTNSKIADFVPSTLQDASSRPDNVFRLFPPFVLTDTMDVLYRGNLGELKIEQYERDVLHALAGRLKTGYCSWKKLKHLGRPLWKSSGDDVHGLSSFAAQKLLLGKSPYKKESLDDSTMYGVASVLCRAGLRPYSSSPLASRVVADFMAILSYVGHEHDQFISSYSSDPVLTLGAARIWHKMTSTALADTILPQFRKMLHQELMDTGGAGEMVARLVLLLVMDACGVLETGKEESRWSRVGEFASVWTFLTALHGDDPKLKQPVSVEN